MIDFHFVFLDSAHAVEQISYFNSWLNLKDVPASSQILPRCNITAYPFQRQHVALTANKKEAWTRMSRDSQVLPVRRVLEKEAMQLSLLSVIISWLCCALVCKLWGALKHQTFSEQGHWEIMSDIIKVHAKSRPVVSLWCSESFCFNGFYHSLFIIKSITICFIVW